MNSWFLTYGIPAIVAVGFIVLQIYFFCDTQKYRKLFLLFFNRNGAYSTYEKNKDGQTFLQIKQVGNSGSDLFKLIDEINKYIEKTKGTTDFAVIQNKVERMLNMRYDQASARLSFPTYLGLMGTFAGVFFGILMFICEFNGVSGISDEAIQKLLGGVLVSMVTSLCGLILTSVNISTLGKARKKIEEDKNIFFDFVQTELMPSLDVSLVAAISHLHNVVDKFEPAFNNVIDRFQNTFDKCTKAFGDNFEKNVSAVAGAVNVMGQHMDKINSNIDLQQKLLATLKSNDLVRGIEKYIEAANRFVSITRAMDKFEEARRMMLAAAQEAIVLQNSYNESLKIPRDIAIRINQILDRITAFEKSINNLAPALVNREMLGNGTIQAIEKQIKGIERKSKIADRYLEMADASLEELYKSQTKALGEINNRYSEALAKHIEGFENMLAKQTEELDRRHSEFIEKLDEKFSIESVKEDFSNLKKLDGIDSIDSKLQNVVDNHVTSKLISEKLDDLTMRFITKQDIHKEIENLKSSIDSIKKDITNRVNNQSSNDKGGGIFGWLTK